MWHKGQTWTPKNQPKKAKTESLLPGPEAIDESKALELESQSQTEMQSSETNETEESHETQSQAESNAGNVPYIGIFRD